MSNLNVINLKKAHIKNNFEHDTCIFIFLFITVNYDSDYGSDSSPFRS